MEVRRWQIRKNYELELYKLLINPEEDDIDISYVDEFGWVSNTEFYVWISLNWFNEFVKRLSDIFGYSLFDEGGIDFLTYNQPWNGDILTNPPYKYAKEFIEHAMTLIPDGCRVFMFLKVQFLEGKARKELFKKYPPKCVYVSSSRILCAKNALFDEMRAGGGSAVAYAWYEFEKGYTGESKLKWIN